MSFHREKLEAAILFVVSHSGVRDLGLTKLYKLLYFADAAHLREHGETITGSEYIKYEHGPVPSRGEKLIKALRRSGALESEVVPHGPHERFELRCIGNVDTSVLTETEREILDATCRRLGGDTATALSERSHREPAWLAAAMLDKMSAELMSYGSAEDPDGL